MQFAGGPDGGGGGGWGGGGGGLGGVFLRRGSNTKVEYIVPSDYLTELEYEKVW